MHAMVQSLLDDYTCRVPDVCIGVLSLGQHGIFVFAQITPACTI